MRYITVCKQYMIPVRGWDLRRPPNFYRAAHPYIGQLTHSTYRQKVMNWRIVKFALLN